MTGVARLDNKIEPEPTSGCWIWIGARHSEGYGCMGGGRRVVRPYAHRVVYEELVAPIAPGLTLDHLCRVRPCVNPAHLEPVALGVNVGRGASRSGVLYVAPKTCKRGHSLVDEPRDAQGRCRACRRLLCH